MKRRNWGKELVAPHLTSVLAETRAMCCADDVRQATREAVALIALANAIRFTPGPRDEAVQAQLDRLMRVSMRRPDSPPPDSPAPAPAFEESVACHRCSGWTLHPDELERCTCTTPLRSPLPPSTEPQPSCESHGEAEPCRRCVKGEATTTGRDEAGSGGGSAVAAAPGSRAHTQGEEGERCRS